MITTVTDKQGQSYSTKRQNVTHAVISWNWDHTIRVAGWTTKGDAAARRMIDGLVHADEVEIITVVG